MLKFLKATLPQPNTCPVSLNFIEKVVEIKQEADHHQICDVCNLQTSEKIFYKKNISTKICPVCDINMSSFVTFNILTQIQSIFDTEYLISQIKNNNNDSNTLLECQRDGSIYKEAAKDKGNNSVIYLNINTDGAALFNSTKYNMWPVLATIVELDNVTREKFDNMIVLGNL